MMIAQEKLVSFIWNNLTIQLGIEKQGHQFQIKGWQLFLVV